MTTVTTATYHSITEAQMIPRLVRLGPNLYGAVFTLMKLLPAHYILQSADRRGELGDGTVVVETTSGTFGLALAMQCALMERELILVSDPAIDPHLYRRLTDLGARVEICPEPAAVGGFQEARLRRLAEIRAELPDTFCPEQYSNPDNPAPTASSPRCSTAPSGTSTASSGPSAPAAPCAAPSAGCASTPRHPRHRRRQPPQRPLRPARRSPGPARPRQQPLARQPRPRGLRRDPLVLGGRGVRPDPLAPRPPRPLPGARPAAPPTSSPSGGPTATPTACAS